MKQESVEFCIPNINAEQRRLRLKSGIITFLIGLVLLPALVTSGISPWWRLLLFPLFAGAASGFFQWRDHT